MVVSVATAAATSHRQLDVLPLQVLSVTVGGCHRHLTFTDLLTVDTHPSARARLAECSRAARRVLVRGRPSARTRLAECSRGAGRVLVRGWPSARTRLAECSRGAGRVLAFARDWPSWQCTTMHVKKPP